MKIQYITKSCTNLVVREHLELFKFVHNWKERARICKCSNLCALEGDRGCWSLLSRNGAIQHVLNKTKRILETVTLRIVQMALELQV
jgi:hypothetical protein